MNNYCVYEHVAPNGKRYIGITNQKPERRWRADGSGYRFNKHFMNAIKKYGWKNFKHNILCDGLSKEDACKKEKELIALYHSNTFACGYNRSAGGEHSDLDNGSKREISQKIKALWENPEYAQHMSDVHKGRSRCGWHHTEETKQVMSAIVRKRNEDPEYRKRISKSAKNRWSIPENKIKARERAKAEWQNEEIRQRFIQSKIGNHYRAKKVICIETGDVFASTKAAALSIGVARETIGQVCRGKREMTHGCHWRFADE